MILREELVDLDLLVFLSMKTKRNLLIWNKNNRNLRKLLSEEENVLLKGETNEGRITKANIISNAFLYCIFFV